MTEVPVLQPFLEPRSVAIVGVTRRTGRGSFNILEILLNTGFRGKAYPVNPNAQEILGVPAYADVRDLPEPAELAIIMLPRRAVPHALRGCAQRGVRAAIVVTEGFAEAGDEEGKLLQAEVVRIAREGGVRVIGPNSIGVVNNFNGLCSTFLPVPPERNPLALVSQSGGFLAGFAEFVAGKAVDLGNMCDVDFSDALENFGQDPQIKVVALHMEGIKGGRRFLEVASRVCREKPVLVLKTGRSPQARQAIASHSGSLVGSDQAFDAACRRAGLLRVTGPDEVGDLTKAFLYLPPFTGDRLAILTPTGGGAVLALDSLPQYGFRLATLSAETVNRLREFWSPWSQPANPLDMMSPGIMHGYGNMFRASLEGLIADPGVDAILCIAGIPTLRAVKEVAQTSPKPVATWVIGPWHHQLLDRVEEVGYRAVYSSPERALRALAARRDFTRRANSR